jgi:hypothetical protein
MATAEEPLTQLATRIPKELHRRLRLYSVTHDIALMHFVAAAIEGEARALTWRRREASGDEGVTSSPACEVKTC